METDLMFKVKQRYIIKMLTILMTNPNKQKQYYSDKFGTVYCLGVVFWLSDPGLILSGLYACLRFWRVSGSLT